MKGQCRISAFRFKFILILFCLVLLYSAVWIFKFQLVSNHIMPKTVALDTDFTTLRRATNISSLNLYHGGLKQRSANESKETETIGEEISKTAAEGSEMHDGTHLDIANNQLKQYTRDKIKMNRENNKTHHKENEQIISVTKALKQNSALNKTKYTRSLNKEKSSLIKMVLEDAKYNGIKALNPSDVSEKHTNSKLDVSKTSKQEIHLVNSIQSNKTSLKSDSSLERDIIKVQPKRLKDVPDNQVEKLSKPTSDTLVFDKKVDVHVKSGNKTHLPVNKRFTFCSVNRDVGKKTKIGILIPSSTRSIKNPTFMNLTLVNTSLPSVYKTLEKQFVYRIYIGIDEGDYLQTVQTAIKIKFDCTIPVVVQGKNYVKSVNSIAERAYKDGMDYLVRINDDTLFVTQNWTSLAVKQLKAYNPENIGVVGPTCKEGNINILTHDMVHRKHLEIFDFYYPPYLENWWTDDWITRVYEPNKSTKLATWVVKHVTFKTRYKVDNEREQWSKTLIKYDKTRLQKYIGCSCVNCADHLVLTLAFALTLILHNIYQL